MDGTIGPVCRVCHDGRGAGRQRRTYTSSHSNTRSPIPADSLPQSILVLKYILQHYEERFIYYGYANVAQNIALMLSAIVLWLAQHTSAEYEYNLTL